MASRPPWRAALLLASLLLLALLAACTASSDAPSAEQAPSSLAAPPSDASAGASGVAAPDLGFPTGPAVLVEVGYEPPRDYVASTGAYLPANGKPTLVYVDAIW